MIGRHYVSPLLLLVCVALGAVSLGQEEKQAPPCADAYQLERAAPLRDLRTVNLHVDNRGERVGIDGKGLRRKAEGRLRRMGIEVMADFQPPNIQVIVDKYTYDRRAVSFVLLLKVQRAVVVQHIGCSCAATVWQEMDFGTVARENAATQVDKGLTRLLHQFEHDWRKANPKG